MIWGSTGNEATGAVENKILLQIGDSPKALAATASVMLRGGRNTPGLLPFVEAAYKKHGAKACQRVIWAYALDADFIRECPSIPVVQAVFKDPGFAQGLKVFGERWRLGK